MKADLEMDGSTSSSNSNSNSPAPFLLKTYEMIDDPLTSSIVSWSQSGHSFTVWNPPEFARDLLPKYFKHNNFSSFIRQLNTYGFRKVDPDQWEFANWEFIQGQKHMLKNIHRRKPIHSHSGSGVNSIPVTESERAEFEEEIERLKQDKISLESQLETYKLENQGYRNQLRLLAQTFLNIDKRQKISALEHHESLSKKRRFVGYNEMNPSLILQDNTNLSSLSLSNADRSETPWEEFVPGIQNVLNLSSLHNVSVARTEENTAEMAVSSGDSDLNVKPCTPECRISVFTSQDQHSCLNIDSPESFVSDSSKKASLNEIKPAEDGSIPIPIPIPIPIQPVGANDVFWEQFLSEAPGSFVE